MTVASATKRPPPEPEPAATPAPASPPRRMALRGAAVAALALASRLFPDLVGQTVVGRLLPDAAVRLSYPVDYWNGLGILVALGLPLLLRSATAIEAGLWRGGAIAGVPLLSSAVF